MKRILLFSVLFLSLKGSSQSTADLDKNYGFKNLRFDAPIDTILKRTKARARYHAKPRDYTYYEVHHHDYLSFGDHWARVHFTMYDPDSTVLNYTLRFNKHIKSEFTELLSLLKSLYGQPTEEDDSSTHYKWKGDVCKMILSYSPADRNTMLHVVNLILDNKILRKRNLEKPQ